MTQAFGRFGYDASRPVIGFEVDREGFRVLHPRADKFRFETAARQWRPLVTSETSQTLNLAGLGRSPQKLRSDLYGCGFELYFPYGFAFRIASLSSPNVSWAEGSVGDGVPTPSVRWALVSFKDPQPPVLLGFPDTPVALKVTGRSGQWTLASVEPARGWVRVVAPLGPVGYPASSAADLGGLVRRVKPEADLHASPVPKLLGLGVEEDALGVVATWRFDRPGAVVPVPVVLAILGGYPVRATTPMKRLAQRNEYGPVHVVDGQVLSVRFPSRRLPTGRSVCLGVPERAGPSTVSAHDVPSVVELALYALACFREPVARGAAANALQEFLAEVPYEVEPFTGQRLPFSASGKGLDLAAAHALLMQAEATAERATSEPNSLLTSIVWRRDVYTWRLWAPDPTVARRAAAIAALAGAICPEPERRLDGAMLQAGLAAERGYREWLRRLGQTPPDEPLLEALEGVRNAFFAVNATPREDGFLKALQSEIRVYGATSYTARRVEGYIALTWLQLEAGPTTLVLASGYPLEVRPGKNVILEGAEEALGFTVVRMSPGEPGYCELLIKPPDWADPLPQAAEVPRYVEVRR